MNTKIMLAVILLLVSLWLGASYAVEEPMAPVAEKAYDIRIIPYAWFLSVDGEITIGNVTESFETDFSDIVDDLNIAFMLRLEAAWGKFGFSLDGIFSDLEAKKDTPVGEVTVNPTLVIGEGDFTYNVYKMGEDPSKETVWFFDVLAGIRYWNIETKVSRPLTDDVENSKDWIEGVIGGRVRVCLTPKWELGFRADYGIGSTESELDQTTWNLIAYADYRISESISLDFGYRFMNIDIESDEIEIFNFDTDLQGPALALTIRF